MQEHDDDRIHGALKRAFPPVDQDLRRDLWPAMVRRLEKPAGPVPWYDWALAAGLAGALLVFPKLVLLLAYHL